MSDSVLVTVSGFPCSGTTTIARSLAEQLSFGLIESGPRYRREALAAGRREEDTASLDLEQLRRIDQEILAEASSGPGVVWEGRLAGWFARELPTAIRIWCFAPGEVRAVRYASREGLSVADGTRRLSEREAMERSLFRVLYGDDCDYAEEVHYDLVLSSHEPSPDTVVARAMERIRSLLDPGSTGH